MFGRQNHSGNSNSSNLVEFRAGRMNMIGKMVHPDTRKGLVYLQQSEDGLMHFCWKDRTTNKVEDDLIVFPDEYEFKRVEQCKTGRVYVLKFKASSRRMFFWMQEPKVEKDEELCRRVNELMNNPPSAQRSGSDSGDLQYVLNNMSQQQLMQLFGGVGQMGGLSSLLGSMNRSGDSSSRTPNRGGNSGANVSTPENASAPRTPSAPKANRTRQGATGKSESGGSGSGTADGGQTATEAGRTIDLSTAITTSEAVIQIADDSQVAKKLSVHLPTSENVDEDKKKIILDTINSPQFQQALTHFSNALQSAQLGPVVSQFELPTDAVNAAFSGNLEEFIKALEKTLPQGTKRSNSESNAADSGGNSATASPAKTTTDAKDATDKEAKDPVTKKKEDNGSTTKKEE